MDFRDTRHLNFPDASHLTKRPKSGTTELPSQIARGGLTALGTRGRGPRAGGPGPPRVLPRRDVVNKPQLHPVGSFAERHPANSPLGDFSQQIPKATKTPATRFCPEKGGVLRTSESNGQFIRKKAGFSGQTRGKVSRTDADCGLTVKLGLKFTDRHRLDFPDTCHLDFPDALHLNFPDTIYLTKRPKSGTTELPSQMARGGLTALGTRGRGPRAGGPGPPRVLPRRDVVNQPQLHPVGSFAERHPANSPLGDFSQQIPKATKTPATRFCP